MLLLFVCLFGYRSTWAELDILNGTFAFQCRYFTDGDKFKDKVLEDWEDEWMDLLEDVTNDLDIDDQVSLSYNAFKSFDDELSRSVASDVGTFAATFIILSILATMFVLRFRSPREENTDSSGSSICRPYVIDMTRSRGLTALFGVVGALLSVGASFGLTGGIFGIKFNSVVSVSPFLLLGLGVDDMFVLLRSYELTSVSLTVEERMKTTMERGGISILFTSVTDLVAFSIGSTSRFGSVSAFCVYCAVGVILDFLFQVTFFLGFMVYDSRWMAKEMQKEKEKEKQEKQKANNNKIAKKDEKIGYFSCLKCCCFCCICCWDSCGCNNSDDAAVGDTSRNLNRKGDNGGSSEETAEADIELGTNNTTTQDELEHQNTETKQLMSKDDASNSPKIINVNDANGGGVENEVHQPQLDNAKSSSVIGHLIEQESSSKFMEILGEFILKDYRVSICVIALFAGYLAGAIYGLTKIETFQDSVDLAPNDSYLRDFYNDFEV